MPEIAEQDIAALYEAHAPFLATVARRKFNVPTDDAAGLVHDVFLAYLRSAQHVYDPAAWLLGAVCNACRYYWRQHRDTAAIDDQCSQISMAEQLHESLLVRTLLNGLSERCQELLRLQYFEGYSVQEIADRISTTPGYAQQLLHKCIKNARQTYEHLR